MVCLCGVVLVFPAEAQHGYEVTPLIIKVYCIRISGHTVSKRGIVNEAVLLSSRFDLLLLLVVLVSKQILEYMRIDSIETIRVITKIRVASCIEKLP